MKTLEDEWYIVKRANNFTVLRFFVSSYIVCPHYPYIAIESTDSRVTINLYTLSPSWQTD